MNVYAMVTELHGGGRFVKFGVSRNPLQRVVEVQCGCPIRIETIIWASLPSEAMAYQIETLIHAEHKADHCSGEWFRWRKGAEAVADASETIRLISERESGGLVTLSRVDGKTRKGKRLSVANEAQISAPEIVYKKRKVLI